MSDPTTQSNYLQITSQSLHLEWNVDFEKTEITGSVSHDLLVNEDDVTEIMRVHVKGTSTSYELKSSHPVMGRALHISLPAGLKKGSKTKVNITYKTTANSTALQWIAKEQTQGKALPYLFSQCQPIYARTLAPLQDTPSVKTTYSANVTCVLPVLMSAIRQQPPSEGPAHDGKVIGKDHVTYSYSQPVPIPSYLIAIACGNVRYRAFPKIEGKSWTSGVWAEPEMIDAAYWEFSEDTGKFLAAEEEFVTPYRFGVYDLLVLPPSFPYGGMENACLSFLTPTLLAGDRSLTCVVVHEATHSWFGNGVTHANASHFWLNEGWTTYMERTLQQILNTPAHRDFAFLIGAKTLQDSLVRAKDTPKYQRLVVDFENGEDPGGAFSRVPYEKGSNFLLHIERVLGGLDVFLPYVREYVTIYTGKSITTDEWKAHLYRYFEKSGGSEKIKALDSIDWNAWLHGEGLELPVKMEYDTTLAEQAYVLANKWHGSRDLTPSELDFKQTDLESFSTNQIIAFLDRLSTLPSLPHTHIAHLDSLYRLSSTSNGELRLRFYELALHGPSPGPEAYALGAIKWVCGDDGTGIVKGRMKFCRPLFKAVSKVDPILAREMFDKFGDSFHPIAKKFIKNDIGA
ncbi:hypothetical protein HWV62_44229 [Athelia sp. TMB]|nr:hypothetical protein HWV62_44229 [Athelia sp. TMB]